MLTAKHKTGLVLFPAFDWAISPSHPEREERLLYTQDQVLEEGLFDIDGITELKPDPVAAEDIQRVHFCVPNVSRVTTESHLISAGGAKTIGSAVVDKEVDRGFALVRPPGHHAMRVVHGARGFCNINIEAVMIEYLRQAYPIERVAIVDTDATLIDHNVPNELASLTVTITNLLDGTDEVLAADTSGTSIVAAYDSDTGVLSHTGTDTVANYQQVLRTVTYDNAAVTPTLSPIAAARR